MNELQKPRFQRIVNDGTANKIERAREWLRSEAENVAINPNDEEAWRELCRARATLRALARCAR